MLIPFAIISAALAPGERFQVVRVRARQAIDIAATFAFVFTSLVPAPSLAAAENLAGNGMVAGSMALAEEMSFSPNALSAAPATITKGMRLRVLAAAYSSTVAQTDGNPFITASGMTVGPGVIAANFLPLGTKVRINGKNHIVEDRMNERYNGRLIIDIWKPSEEQAFQWGVRQVELTIVSLP